MNFMAYSASYRGVLLRDSIPPTPGDTSKTGSANVFLHLLFPLFRAIVGQMMPVRSGLIWWAPAKLHRHLAFLAHREIVTGWSVLLKGANVIVGLDFDALVGLECLYCHHTSVSSLSSYNFLISKPAVRFCVPFALLRTRLPWEDNGNWCLESFSSRVVDPWL